MPWYLHVAQFFGGAFAANAIPHLVSGMTGKQFQTPFASPPFRGLSPPGVNVAWALFNVALAYVLLLQIGEFEPRRWIDAAIAFAGFGAMAFQCVRALRRINSEREAQASAKAIGS